MKRIRIIKRESSFDRSIGDKKHTRKDTQSNRLMPEGRTSSPMIMDALEKIMSISPYVFLVAGFLLQGPLMAQQEHASEKGKQHGAQSDVYPLPILFYTPETGFAGGAAAMYLYRDSLSQRASNLSADIIYTEKKQLVAEIAGDQYFEEGRYRLVSYLSYQKMPNKFFGIGNNTLETNEEIYTPRRLLARVALSGNLASYVNIGPMAIYENVSRLETAPGGILSGGVLPGSSGGSSVGVGIVLNWDSRDNTFSTQSGSFYQVTAMFYRSGFGSDYNYDDVQIDARTFFRIFSDQVVAVQGVGEFIDGSAPFHSYAKCGGKNILRGYFDGRYRDKNAVAIQAEYRIPVWWRFGIVGFAGIGQVADRINGLAQDRFWFAGGAGLRFALSPEERINLRLDFGAGKNSSGMYITMAEAF